MVKHKVKLVDDCFKSLTAGKHDEVYCFLHKGDRLIFQVQKPLEELVRVIVDFDAIGQVKTIDVQQEEPVNA